MEEIKNSTSNDAVAEMPQLTTESVSYLLKAAKWGKFLAILGFIITSLMIVAAIAMSFILNKVQDDLVPLNLPFSPKLLSIIYIIFAGITLIPIIFLNAFSNNAIRAVNLGSTEKLTSSIRNLKNLSVFVGVSTIVILAFYTLALIIVGTAAVIGF
jgi:preprotein translocase subunit SecG